MPRRTYEKDGERVENARDLDEIVNDKRSGWRANPATARRRQRRYKKRALQASWEHLKDDES